MIQKTYLKTKDYCKVKFTFDGTDADNIAIHGLQGDWNKPVALKKKKDGSFWCEISLPKDSQHEFKYLVDGIEWMNEPTADSEVQNEFGGRNSLLII